MTTSNSVIGLFPDSWSHCLIEQAGETILGQTKQPLNADGELGPYLRVANVQDGMLDLAEISQMPFVNPEHYLLQQNDILLCEGQSKELVGRAAPYLGEPAPLYFQNHLLRFRPATGIDAGYALLVFRAYQKTGVFSALAKGTTNLANLGRARFVSLPFPLPPTAVQQEIALCGRGVQDSIDLIREALESCSSQLDSVVREARDLEILGAHRLTWSGATFGTSPWPLLPASEIVPKDAPIIYGIIQPGPEDPNGVPFIRGQDLQEGYVLEGQLHRTSPEIAERYSRSSLAVGDVLLGIIRHTRVAIVSPSLAGANITQGTARVRPSDNVTSSYLAHWFASGVAQTWLHAKMRGIDMPGLNLADVRNLPVPLPPIEEQSRIAAALDAVVNRARDLANSLGRLLEQLPHLEAELVASLAYGEQAAVISSEISGSMQSVLSEELASELAVEERRRRTTRRPQQGRKRSGMAELAENRNSTNRTKLIAALQGFDNPCSPESLFAYMRLDPIAVDSFYVALRQLHRDGIVTIYRPDSSRVLIAPVDVL